jgi:hypothetical protein
VSIRARVPDVLVQIGLGKENAQADSACRFGVRCTESLGSCNNGSKVGNVIEWGIRADSDDCGHLFRLKADSDSDRSRTAFR